jgi:hypothetical protein
MSEELNTVVTPILPIAPITPQSLQQVEGKVFTEEYVKGLREEAKENRLAKKNLEAKLKTLIGLKDDEDLDDAKITSYQAQKKAEVENAITKANERLILAEIKSLEGYDAKLVDRLLDKSKVTIADDGTITGIKEAVEALAIEYPQIKTVVNGNPANPPVNQTTEIEQIQADYDKAVKAGDTVNAVRLKNILFSMGK